MMYQETQYLTWANRLFGSVKYNLARGGMRPVDLRDIGVPAPLDDSSSWERLRAHIARYNAIGVDEVLPTLGTTHALWLAFAALVRPGDDVLVERPGYEPLWRIPEGMGANIVRFDRRLEDGFAARADAIATRLTPRTRVVALTNSHNPSGVSTTDSELRELAKVCDGVGAQLLVDEIYMPFGSHLGSDGVWGRSARHIAPNVVAVSGLSKAYGLGALRVGWIAADRRLVRAAQHAMQSSLGDPPLAQTCLGAHVFAHLPALAAARERQFPPQLRDTVARWIAARPHLEWHEPPGGPFGFVRLRGAGDLTADIERGAEQHDVLVAPGGFFGTPDAFRLGWSVDPGDLIDALDRLDEVLSAALSRADLISTLPGRSPALDGTPHVPPTP
jgi:aspartate/methionine/tyrosine aminotransferase